MEETKAKKDRPQNKNLKPFTVETAREAGSKGGYKTAEVLRNRKMLSDYYADYLAKANGVDGYTDIKDVISEVLARGDSASVSMMKEIREATEGSKVEHSGSMNMITAPLSVEEARRRMMEIESDL